MFVSQPQGAKLTSEFATTNVYTIRQIDSHKTVLSEKQVEAVSSEAAAKQLKQVVDETDKIEVTLNGETVNEMGVSYWKQRIRRR
ncbi:hypothetical protein [Rosistilla carotiformis]|uniref:hypothetical protein n=1 Tax=Rosistilla carotiformis TaxID=2528017 RepID=UPI0011A62A1B|nr:hypothetical protein [Rosistilla carotiformis]